MKDYSQFFRNPESFIVGCSVDTKNDKIKANFSKKSGNTEFEYPLDRKRVSRFHSRLTNQYKKLINNKQFFLKSKKRKANKLRKALLITVLALGLGSGLFGFLGFEILQLSALVSTTAATGLLIINELSRYFEKQDLDLYQEFMQRNKELEEASKEDDNILASVRSKVTTDALEEQKVLQEKGLVDNVFNTFFMDRAIPNDLRHMLDALDIYCGLKHDVEFSTNEGKTRKRIKQ